MTLYALLAGAPLQQIWRERVALAVRAVAGILRDSFGGSAREVILTLDVEPVGYRSGLS